MIKGKGQRCEKFSCFRVLDKQIKKILVSRFLKQRIVEVPAPGVGENLATGLVVFLRVNLRIILILIKPHDMYNNVWLELT